MNLMLLRAARQTILATAALAGSLLLSGCLPSEPIVGGAPHPKGQKRVQTVVSLSPGTSEVCALSGIRLVGRTASDDYPATVKSVPIIMKGVHPDFEAIVALKPDLVLYDVDLSSPADIAKLKDLKLETMAIGGDTVEDFLKDLYRLASRAGTEGMMVSSVRTVEKAVENAKADPFATPPKVAILLPSPNSNPLIAGTKSFYADLVRSAAAEPCGPDANKFVPIGIEQLTQLDPDAIIVGGTDFSALTNNPAFAGLRAVKTGKYFSVPPDLLERRGIRVDKAVTGIHASLKSLFKS